MDESPVLEANYNPDTELSIQNIEEVKYDLESPIASDAEASQSELDVLRKEPLLMELLQNLIKSIDELLYY